LTLGVGNYVIPPLGNYLTLEGLRLGNCLIADRVLYVGASRAEQLLAFGAGPNASRVAGLLTRDNVTVSQI
jgi:hypothetical protein